MFGADQLVEVLLIFSLLIAIIITVLVTRLTRISGFALSFISSIVFFVLWSFLWASAEEGYIYFCVPEGSAEDGIGKSRYIYPDHSGMGWADGFKNYAKNIFPILAVSTVIGILSGSIVEVVRRYRTIQKARKVGLAEQNGESDS
jgi:hypothetical protein